MGIKRAGSQPSGKGPAGWFTSTASVDPLFSPPDPARVNGALVTFAPGEKHWHGAAGQTPVQEKPDQLVSAMKIDIEIEGATITATLDDGPAARDFASLLPLALTLEDYNSTEKISQLPRRLSIEGAPAGADPAPGDITYYAPWGNLAIFYKDFGYSSGLVRLGAIVAGGEALDVPGPVQATIRLAE